MNEVPELQASVAYAAFFKAVANEHIIRSLGKSEPATLAELVSRQRKYIQQEELLQAHERTFYADEAGFFKKRKPEQSPPRSPRRKQLELGQSSQ